ncbi:MAG: flagellar protein FliS [candidate division Zixibacteria bacterium]|nr:flagellar protein FliS [candidate division Zixibacteria bacterium]
MAGKVSEYQRNDTLGKSQLDLVIKVYDGAISAFKSAKKNYIDNEIREGYEQLEKVRKFVTHLYTTLDFKQGGEIAEQLSKLYVFILTQLDVIEATKDLKKIDDNIKILNNLRSGWTGLKQQGAGVPKNVPAKEPVPVSGGQFTTSA